MDFAMVTAYHPIDQLVPLARAAEEAGFTALSLADHVVDLETLATPYPYTRDGERRWAPDVDWPDPWVTIGALSQVTTELRFFTSIYVAAMRNPFVVAKAVGTAAALSGGRVALGVGVGWCREEFELLEEDFATRGRRTDEGLDLMRELWRPGWTEFAGEFYSCERLVMLPEPPGPIPVWVGGLSEVALRRAARNDGWIGDMATVDEAIAIVERLSALRRGAGKDPDEPFAVVPALTDAFAPEDFVRAARGGVTMCMTMPWMYYYPPHATVEQRLDGIARFGAEVIAPTRALLGG
ncbi:TIGR03619 family F420-dependent LLM class oxidoreductase [Nocardioides daeguensis]|uniref:TIGR03619 family F420-dependent LLM class oxidoreductase n=1 Tax=Nocardioides daeguensis TaxID=908359 RepID=A0ABP6VJ54_9ACTN|nr:TIGR03619 family F420-dependent LLM class oxidoreductase [Nocardioides daeguensis]MBV6728909.1 TIGR03619 family F420-dependent LLM class oxidoreductase [Nocardioides daeguensis]MCR1773430.1 TIGR03619 family F420-dependent LLM class oxidoreductase [Nocardioides daeguensis]